MKNSYKVIRVDNKKLIWALNYSQDSTFCEEINIFNKIILNGSSSDINIDFADISTILDEGNYSLLISIEKSEVKNLEKLLLDIIKKEIIDCGLQSKAMGMLLSFNINPNLSIFNLSEAMDIVYENLHENASVIFGTNNNSSVSIDEIEMTIVISYM